MSRKKSPGIRTQHHFEKIIFTHSEGTGSELSSLQDLNFASYEEQQNVTKLTSPIKRLFKDYIEVKNSPLPYVSISPLKSDFFQWRGNLFGPEDTNYVGGIFHFGIEFPADYPRSPPSIAMYTRIHHPCVSGQTITLPFFAVHDDTSIIKNRYAFWTPDYSAFSILLQLQSLLFQGNVETALESVSFEQYDSQKRNWITAVNGSVEQSLLYKDTISNHRPRHPWPPKNDSTKVEHFLNDKTSPLQIGAEHAICFFTKRTYEESVLGLGVNISKNVRTGKIQTVYCSTDIISLNAFKGLKIDKMFGENFSHHFPLYLVDTHYKKSMKLIKTSISRLYTGIPKLEEFKGDMALDFFPKCLIKLTLQFLERDGDKARRTLYAFCYMHRVLIQLAIEEKRLIHECKQAIKRFVEDPKNRDKDMIASVAELLILLLISGDTWSEDFCTAYIEEVLDRNVFWLTKKFPKLDKSEPDSEVDKFRAEKSFEISKTGNLLVVILLSFSNIFAGSSRTLADIAKYYDDNFGLLSAEDLDKVIEEKKRILEIDNYKKYFDAVAYKIESEEEIVSKLRQAVKRSAEKKYHRDRGIEVISPEEFEKQRLGSIKPLKEMFVQTPETTDESEKQLLDDEKEWKHLMDVRFGFSELPKDHVSHPKPWRQLYLQYSLQELVSKLNDNPDFKNLYQTADICAKYLTHFEMTTFKPDNLKSEFFFVAKILQKLESLTHLKIAKGELGLGKKGFKELIKGLEKASGSLQVLDLGYSDLMETSVAALAESHLTSDQLYLLNLEGNPLGNKGTQQLAELLCKHRSLPNLKELNLRLCSINDEGIKLLAEGLLVKKHIRYLNVSKNNFTAHGLSHVIRNMSYSSVIEEINISELKSVKGTGNDSHELVIAFMKLFKFSISLKKINLWQTQVGLYLREIATKELAHNSALEILDMVSCGIVNMKNITIGLMSKENRVRELILDSNSGLSFSSIISTCDYFDAKDLPPAKKPHPTSVEILKLNSISTFSGQLGNLRNRGSFVKFLNKIFTNLSELELSKANLDASSAEGLSEYLKLNPILKKLDLSHNSLGKHGARILCQGLSANTNLQMLKVDHNNFLSAGAKYFAELLKVPQCGLKNISFFCNYFDVPGVTEIAEALKINKMLEEIDLGMNRVRKRGAALITDALTQNATLKTIKLKFNLIPDEFAIKLVTSILSTEKSGIAEIYLAGNNLQYETLVTIVDQVNKSGKPVKFDLSRRAEYLDPERIERTVYLSPLAANVSLEMVKRLFYTKKCGAIKSVKVEKHKKKGSFALAKYSLVEFANKESVDLALDLVNQGVNKIGSGLPIRIMRAGLGKGVTLDPAI